MHQREQDLQEARDAPLRPSLRPEVSGPLLPAQVRRPEPPDDAPALPTSIAQARTAAQVSGDPDPLTAHARRVRRARPVAGEGTLPFVLRAQLLGALPRDACG